MKKLLLCFLFLFLAGQFPTQGYSATSKSKHSKKKTAKKTTKKSAKATVKTPAAAPVVQVAPQPPPRPAGPSAAQLMTAYNYAYALYAAKQFDKAKEIFKKVAMISTQPDLNSNALYYYSQCAFRTEDYNGCVKALSILAKKHPNSAAIRKGYVSGFCVFLIDQVSKLQTNWDYYRYKERTDEKGNPLWKESIPPGFKIKRINFKLGFGLYRVLNAIQPDTPQALAAKQKLTAMLNTPLTMVWVDEKAPPNKWDHPGDFLSYFSIPAKKDFSKVICERMFFDWQSEKFYLFLDMHDDVRNLKPRFIAHTKIPEESSPAQGTSAPPVPLVPGASVTTASPTDQQDPSIVLTLNKLFLVTGYFPWNDSYTNVIESSPADLNL